MKSRIRALLDAALEPRPRKSFAESACPAERQAQKRKRQGSRRYISDGEMSCLECGEYKSLTEFYVHRLKTGRATYDSRCNPCRKAAQVAKRYGMTVNEYREWIAVSGGKCKICGEDCAERPAIDHCHASGTVRGVLCVRCNSGLGQFRDSPQLLLAAATYLDPNALDNV